MPTLAVIRTSTGTVSSVGAGTRVAIEPSTGPLEIEVLRVSIRCTVAPTAATFTARIYDTSAGVAGSINQRWQGSVNAVGVLFDVAAIGSFLTTDANGRFYLEFGPNAGADSTFVYNVTWKIV